MADSAKSSISIISSIIRKRSQRLVKTTVSLPLSCHGPLHCFFEIFVNFPLSNNSLVLFVYSFHCLEEENVIRHFERYYTFEKQFCFRSPHLPYIWILSHYGLVTHGTGAFPLVESHMTRKQGMWYRKWCSLEQAKFHGTLCAIGWMIGLLSSKDMDGFSNTGVYQLWSIL